MDEKVKRKPAYGMTKILDINEHSRFINLLAIKRRDTQADGENVSKRCQGAKETLEFGSNLTQTKSDNCSNLTSSGKSTQNVDPNIIKLEQEIQKLTQDINKLQSQLSQPTTATVEGGSRRKRLNTKSKSLTARINTQKTKKNNNKKRRSQKVNRPISNYRSKKSKK